MMFSPVPDKLSVMTYVFQIKTYFSRPPPLPPSPLSLTKPTPRSRPAPPPPQAVATAKEGPVDIDDVNLVCDSSDINSRGQGKDRSEEALNPFLDDNEDIAMDSTAEVSTDASATALSDASEGRSSGKVETDLSRTSSESKRSVQESINKERDAHAKTAMKPPPKPPRMFETTGSSSVDTLTKTSDSVDKKGKSESKGYNPFDEYEKEDVVVDKKSTTPSKVRKPPQGYNPFDDDEGVESQEKVINDKENKVGYNPFDEDDVTQTETVIDQNTGKKDKAKKKISYPHSFNPFEDVGGGDLKPNEHTKSSRRIETKDGKSGKQSLSKGLNPFDDDEDEGGVSSEASQVESKSSLENKEKLGQAGQTGRASPSSLTEQPVST